MIESHNENEVAEMLTCPFAQLQIWLKEAIASGMRYPTAMTLATLGEDNKLDQRTVLLKHCDTSGLVFFAGDTSKKIRDCVWHPQISVHFSWLELDRQVRVTGKVEKLPSSLTTRYLITEPEYEKAESEAVIDEDEIYTGTRHFLIKQFNTMRSKFYGSAIRFSEHWSGFRIIPDHFEYWQGGGPNLRNRFVYERSADGGWKVFPLRD